MTEPRLECAADPEPVIRSLASVEAPRVTDFLWRTFVATYGHVGSAANLELLRARSYDPEIQRAELASGDIEHWVIECYGAWAGLCQLRLRTPAPDCVALRPALEVGRFYFDLGFQGTGHAARLMTHIKQRAAQQGAAAIWLSVWKQAQQAIRFYEKQHFVAVGSMTYWYGDEAKDDWVMQHPLPRAQD